MNDRDVYREIELIKAWLKLSKGILPNMVTIQTADMINKMKGKMHELRQHLASFKPMQEGDYRRKEEELIWSRMSTLFDREDLWRASYPAHIAPHPFCRAQNDGREKPTKRKMYVLNNIQVKAMWRHKCYDKLHSLHGGLIDRSLILSADEYKINVKNIRLYSVTAFSLEKREIITGWVGQSKIGKQLCALRTTRDSAIMAARQLASAHVSKLLNLGETDNG